MFTVSTFASKILQNYNVGSNSGSHYCPQRKAGGSQLMLWINMGRLAKHKILLAVLCSIAHVFRASADSHQALRCCPRKIKIMEYLIMMTQSHKSGWKIVLYERDAGCTLGAIMCCHNHIIKLNENTVCQIRKKSKYQGYINNRLLHTLIFLKPFAASATVESWLRGCVFF